MAFSTETTAQRRRFSLRWLGEARIAALFFFTLLVINVVLTPGRFAPTQLGVLFGLAAPLILATMAATPVILSGGGGIDISVGPLMALINALIIQVLIVNNGITSPLAILPAILLAGLASGLLNGFLSVVVRIQPIVATLGTYLIYSGLTIYIMPAPGGSVPDWMATLSSSASIVPIIAVAAAWFAITRLPYYEHLMATGGDARATYTSGVPIVWVRLIAYALTGMFAAVAGLSLTALLGSGDPNVGQQYTLTAIAATALGGVSLAGGRGGIVGAILGASSIFLMQNLLIYFNVSTFLLQMAYGTILVVAVVLNSEVVKRKLGQ
ncbi:MAG: ABC transporter permease [Burkholderiales bacterium]|nr:ABC transporter permease [Anaerolineae bacterium]